MVDNVRASKAAERGIHARRLGSGPELGGLGEESCGTRLPAWILVEVEFDAVDVPEPGAYKIGVQGVVPAGDEAEADVRLCGDEEAR